MIILIPTKSFSHIIFDGYNSKLFTTVTCLSEMIRHTPNFKWKNNHSLKWSRSSMAWNLATFHRSSWQHKVRRSVTGTKRALVCSRNHRSRGQRKVSRQLRYQGRWRGDLMKRGGYSSYYYIISIFLTVFFGPPGSPTYCILECSICDFFSLVHSGSVYGSEREVLWWSCILYPPFLSLSSFSPHLSRPHYLLTSLDFLPTFALSS